LDVFSLIGIKGLKTERLIEIDVLRSVAILLIVYYHLPSSEGYVISESSPYYIFSQSLGFLGVALFFFISGFVIDLHYKNIRTSADVSKFYKKRAKRIYPLYWLALTVQLIFPILLVISLRFFTSFHTATPSFQTQGLDPFTILVSYLGLQVLLGLWASIEVIWFVGVILIYYAIYPLTIILSSNDVRKVIIISSCVLVLFVLYNALAVQIDPRFFLYYFIFFAGIVTSRIGTFNKKNVRRNVFVFAAMLAILVLLQITSTQFRWPSIVVFGQPLLFFDCAMTVLILLALTIARYYASALSAKARLLFSFLAFASYCVFLLHQTCLALLRVFLRDILHLGLIETIVVASLFGVPLIFLLCFYIQRSVDSLVDNSVLRITNIKRHINRLF
jgi:peptidoglycan/LPS O-acetylase OafA/YrhL